ILLGNRLQHQTDRTDPADPSDPPPYSNLKEYRSASFIANRSRTGFPARRPTSPPAFQVTARSISFPISSWPSARLNPGIARPSASWISTRIPPGAEVAKFTVRRLPVKVNGRVTISPPE